MIATNTIKKLYLARNRCLNFQSIFLVSLLFAGFVSPLRADDLMDQPAKAAKATHLHYLTAQMPDPIALLAPPPLAGSSEQAADLNETIAVHKQMSSAALTAAAAEEKFSLFSFANAVGPILQPGKLPKSEAFMKRVLEDTVSATDTGKNFFKRPRPYVVDPELANGPGEIEKSFSYPSGHSTRGTVFALVLAELFPAQQNAILVRGREIGWHRVELARHYPTDIYAGRVLAQAIVREMKKNPEFQKDLAEAKQEIAAASKTAENQPQAPSSLAVH